MGVNYSEASFFDGAHFKHIADWLEYRRERRILTTALTVVASNEGDKARRKWLFAAN